MPHSAPLLSAWGSAYVTPRANPPPNKDSCSHALRHIHTHTHIPNLGTAVSAYSRNSLLYGGWYSCYINVYHLLSVLPTSALEGVYREVLQGGGIQ